MIRDQTTKYFLYARKSTESEDRQVLSIDSQIEELKKIAEENQLQIVEVLSESKSAKAPGRPVFNKMMARIYQGEAEGILCWKLDRLARNPVDGGQISWMLQQGVIKHIQTRERGYFPSDNVLMISVEFGMANQFLRDLAIGVKRGLEKKLRMGWRPGAAPTGYLNERLEHTILPDPERFDLIRKAWDYMLTGSYTVPQILKKLNEEWGFRTKKTKRMGDNPMSMSGLYAIFTNLFYAGIILHKGREYNGIHKAMITLDEYNRVQIILGRKGKPRSKKHAFPFTGLIRCGECGCSITAETKNKLIKSTKEIKHYTYYHCTRRRRDVLCSQKKVTSAEEIENQIIKEIGKFTILPEFKDLALEVLNQSNDLEIVDRTKIYEMQQKAINEAQKQLDNLTQMRCRELIDDEEYLKEKQLLQLELNKLKQQQKETESRAENWLELTEKTFDFACYARIRFINGDIETKKAILAAIGSNWTLKDGKLSIQANECLQPIINGYPALEKEYLALEPVKLPLSKAKTERLNSVFTRWQGR